MYVRNVIMCCEQFFLVANMFNLFDGGKHVKYTEEGVMYVMEDMQQFGLTLVPVFNDAALLACTGVHADDGMILLVDEV
jgi:hypothetical protein